MSALPPDEPVDIAVVPLDALRAEWLHTKGGDDVGAVLLGMLDAEIRDATVKKAIADEHHVLLMIRRHARLLKGRTLGPRKAWTDEHYKTANALDLEAEQQVLAMFERSDDPVMRAAAERVRHRFGILSGRISNRNHSGTEQLRRLREARPGGWK